MCSVTTGQELYPQQGRVRRCAWSLAPSRTLAPPASLLCPLMLLVSLQLVKMLRQPLSCCFNLDAFLTNGVSSFLLNLFLLYSAGAFCRFNDLSLSIIFLSTPCAFFYLRDSTDTLFNSVLSPHCGPESVFFSFVLITNHSTLLMCNTIILHKPLAYGLI